MPMKWTKLLPLGVMLAQAVGYYVYRSHRGWQLDFNGVARTSIAHRGHSISVAIGSRRILTADSALVGFELSEPWTFSLVRQGWLRLDAELVTGVREVDERLQIGIESQRFADRLIADADLRTHLLQIDATLAAHQARFERLESTDRDLRLLVFVRRCKDLPALWRALVDWLVVFDAALVAARPAARASMVSPAAAKRPGRKAGIQGTGPAGSE